ncbi:hypothetical protein FQA39_LY13244 [Lamprigera yunnana]|nr:hypothetical protein FQA39_LY13244 [Lamprigera yunnana]
MWMLYSEQHWTKAMDLKSAVERLYEKLGALEFDTDHEAIYGKKRYYTVQQCEQLRDKYKIGRKNLITCSLHSLYRKEFNVTPFCNINLKLPYNVSFIPLDLYEYPNCDKVIVNLEGENESYKIDCVQKEDVIDISSVLDNCNGSTEVICKIEAPVKANLYEYPNCDKVIVNLEGENESYKIDCVQKEDVIDISSVLDNCNGSTEVICKIEAPVKANINASSQNGNIRIANFQGSTIKVQTSNGNIYASKCISDSISLISLSGNITCKSVMQAAIIHLLTGKDGSISTEKLQGVTLLIKTLNGDIQTKSAYCDNSSFITEAGNLQLSNVHKKCQIVSKGNGKLHVIGFDGTLEAFAQRGNHIIQIVRVEGDSKIEIAEEGTLNLKVTEDCVKNTSFKLFSKALNISPDLNVLVEVGKNFRVLKTTRTITRTLVDCPHSNVIVSNLSFQEMFNLQMIDLFNNLNGKFFETTDTIKKLLILKKQKNNLEVLKLFDKLCDVQAMIDEVLGLPILCLTWLVALQCLQTLNFILEFKLVYDGISVDFDVSEVFLNAALSAILIMCTVSIAYSTDTIKKENQHTKSICYKILLDLRCTHKNHGLLEYNLREEVLQLIQQVQYRDPKFTAANCYVVDVTLISRVLMMVLAHVVILMQFD